MIKLLAFLLALAAPAQAQNTPAHSVPVGQGPGVIGFGSAGPCATNQVLAWTGGVGADPACASAGVGGSPGGSSGQVQYNNAGTFGGLTNTQLTADINVATASLSGALPAWPGNTTTFFRGDGTYAALACANLPALTGDITSSACATTLATVNANTGSWGTATQASQFTVNGKGLITAAANVTIAPPFSAITGQATLAQLPSIAGNTILSNVTGGATTPAANSPSAVLDIFSSTQGAVLYRDAGAWLALAPGTSGQLLSSGGAAANPSWITASGTGTVTSVANDGSIKSSVASNGAITTTGTLSLFGEAGSLTNCTLVGTVAANALTVAIKTQAGADPSSTAACVISFRNATIATGDYTYVKVTAATSFATATSGDTFGAVNSTAFRLWITAWNNAGTVVLGVSKQSTAAQIFPLNEGAVQSSTACNACGTATSSGVFYTTTAQTSKAIRILGYMDWASGLATAGTWASGPTTIQLMGPGVKKPGDEVQRVYTILTTTTSQASTATSPPTFSDVAGLTATITPTSTPNLIEITGLLNGGVPAVNGPGYVRFVRGTTPICVQTGGGGNQPVAMGEMTTIAGANASSLSGLCLDAPGTVSSTAYKWQIAGVGGTFYVNFTASDANSNSRLRGASNIQVREIQG